MAIRLAVFDRHMKCLSLTSDIRSKLMEKLLQSLCWFRNVINTSLVESKFYLKKILIFMNLHKKALHPNWQSLHQLKLRFHMTVPSPQSVCDTSVPAPLKKKCNHTWKIVFHPRATTPAAYSSAYLRQMSLSMKTFRQFCHHDHHPLSGKWRSRRWSNIYFAYSATIHRTHPSLEGGETSLYWERKREWESR